MSRKELLMLNATGTIDLSQIDWGAVSASEVSETISLRVYNSEINETAVDCRLNAGRADMTIAGYPSEDADVGLENGSELAGESWVEARITGNSTWTPIDENIAFLDLGSIAAQGHVDIDVRINIPGNAISFGEVGFNLIVRCK